MRKTLYRSLTLILLSIFAISCSTGKNETDAKIDKIISEMTLEEKVGQMTQITLDVIGNGEGRHESKVPFEIDTARIRKAIVEYHVGSVLNTTNN